MLRLPCEFWLFVCLKVEFLLKTDSGYPKDTGVNKPWQPLVRDRRPALHWSAPLPLLEPSHLVHSGGTPWDPRAHQKQLRCPLLARPLTTAAVCTRSAVLSLLAPRLSSSELPCAWHYSSGAFSLANLYTHSALPLHLIFACIHVAMHARATAAPWLLLLAHTALLSRIWFPNYLRSQNPAQILVPTRPRCTTGKGHWLTPDLVGKWSHSPALPFPQHAQTNTFLILNPSVTLPLFRFVVFPYTPILPPRPFPLSLPPGRQTNLKCPPFSTYYFMTHSLTTHFFFCVWVCTLKQTCLHKKQGAPFLTQAQQNPAKALPFLPQAQTNTILILNPSFKSSLFPFPRSPRVWSLRPKLKKQKYTDRARLAVGGLGNSTQSNSSFGIFFYWIFFSWRIGPCGLAPPPPLECNSILPLVTAVLITPKGAESPGSSRMGVIGALVLILPSETV